MTIRLGRGFLFLVLIAVTAVAGAEAQGIRGLNANVVAGPVTFNVNTDDPIAAFSFDDMVYGAAITRQGLYVGLQFGRSPSSNSLVEGDLELYDIVLGISGSILDERMDNLPVYIPVLLHSTYRRVRRDDGNSEFALFEYTGLGLGAGLGVRQQTERFVFNARVTPGIGLATRSFGGGTGRTVLVDGDVSLSTGPVVGRFGLSVGYAYRWQEWRVGGPASFGGSDKLTYDGMSHVVRVGLSW